MILFLWYVSLCFTVLLRFLSFVLPSGNALDFCSENYLILTRNTKKSKEKWHLPQMICNYRQMVSLIEGVDHEDIEGQDLPSWEEILDHPERASNYDFTLTTQAHMYMRAFLLTKDFSSISTDGLLHKLNASHRPLRPIFLVGVFYEGLVSFHLARDQSEYHSKGNEALAFIGTYAQSNPSFFENKRFLLEAMRLELTNSDQADTFYLKSVQSARKHKLIHEEALASEMTGAYFYSKGQQDKSLSFFSHSLKCYREWGAKAVAQRVEINMQDKFSLTTMLQHQNRSVAENYNYSWWGFANEEDQSRKRSI